MKDKFLLFCYHFTYLSNKNVTILRILVTQVTSAHHHIEQKINKMPKGSLVFLSDFRGMGTQASIKMALSRLTKEEKLYRLAQGIYYLPKKDPVLGPIKPSLEEVAQAIAERDHVRIKPTGNYALNRLGLSTQVPMNIVYLTDGPRRTIKIGRAVIRFKPTTPKKLSTKGPISSLVIAALEEIGPENLTEDMKQRIKSMLAKEKGDLLLHDMALAPAKLYDFLLQLLNEIKNDQMAIPH